MNLSLKTLLVRGLAALTAVCALSAQAMDLGSLPLWFEASGPTQFTAHGRDAEFSITPAGAEFALHRADGHLGAAHMTFVGAAPGPLLVGDAALGGKINYLLGNDPAQWQTGVPTFAKVRLDQIYPGVDVVYYGNQQRLEYDFDLAAGVNPQTIAIRFDGAEKISVNPAGELVIQLDGGQIVQPAPLAYQTIAGDRRTVTAGYKILDAHTVTFAIGDFDHAQPLVIDPILGYSAFFGGNHGEIAWAIAIDPVDSSIYIAGQTFSTLVSNGPPVFLFATTNAGAAGDFSTNYTGGTLFGDAFVAKFDSTGSNLDYCTYVGGTKDQAAYALAVDSSHHVFITGTTDSSNFPVANAISSGAGSYNGSNVSGVFDSRAPLFHYPSDVFVTELAADGASPVYSTYLGGSGYENSYAIAVDGPGNAYVTGITYSTNFPVTTNAYLNHLVCSNNPTINGNAFVSEIAAGGKVLNYSTYLGGTNFDVGHAIACSAYNGGSVFVAGFTTSTNFPRTNNIVGFKFLNAGLGLSTDNASASDAFVTMFTNSVTGLGIRYSTFLGGSNNDVATGITADSDGNAYVVGWTTSTNFPNSSNGVALHSSVITNTSGFVSGTNAFLTKIGWDGSRATNLFSRVFGGGDGVDVANGVALDPVSGDVYVVGSSSSFTNFPVSRGIIFGSLKATNTGRSDVFVTAFKADFSSVLYSTLIGGKQDDFGNGIAVDADGNAWITGQTLSTNYPSYGISSSNSAIHVRMVGTNDAFLTKILTVGGPVLNAGLVGTNFLVYWAPVSDVTSSNQLLETITNLPVYAISNKLTLGTNISYTTNFVSVVTTNMSMPVTNTVPEVTTNKTAFTNYFPIQRWIGNTNWTVVTNIVPLATNGTYSGNYLYFFDPTNRVRFFRFRP